MSEVEQTPEYSGSRDGEASESEFDLNNMPQLDLMGIFDCFDSDGDGFIDR